MNGYKVKVSLYEVNVSHIEEFPDTFSTTAWLSYKDLAKLVPNINWSGVMSLLNKKYDNLVRSPMLSAEEYDAADLYDIQSSSEDITFMPFNMTVGFALPSKHSYPKCFIPQGQSYWNSLCDTIVHDNLSPISAYVKLSNADPEDMGFAGQKYLHYVPGELVDTDRRLKADSGDRTTHLNWGYKILDTVQSENEVVFNYHVEGVPRSLLTSSDELIFKVVPGA
jgi:hypothetical protein